MRIIALASHSRPLLPTIASAIVLAGCSPLGWYDTPPPRYPPPQQQTAPPVQRDAMPPTSRAQAPATPRPQKASTRQPAIQIVQTGREGTYYVIDRARGLCFFHNGGAVTRIECSTLPEARDLARKQAGEVPHRGDEAGRSNAARPTAPPRPPEEQKPARTFEGSKRGHSAGGNQTPTADEATRFTQAYVAIFCTRQSGGGEDPRTTIQRHGLDVARYSEIEAYMARDDARWRALTQAALAGCR